MDVPEVNFRKVSMSVFDAQRLESFPKNFLVAGHNSHFKGNLWCRIDSVPGE